MDAGSATAENRRSSRLDGDDLHRRVVLLEDAADAGDRAAGTDTGDEHVDLAVERSDDLGPRRPDVRIGVRRVLELPGHPRVRLGGRSLRLSDSLVHPAHRLDDLDRRAVELQEDFALARHPLRQVHG